VVRGMGTRVLAVVMSVLLAPSTSATQEPGVRIWRITDTSQVVDLSIASSGGVSIGAYQAGVSWMLAELLKFLRDNPADRARYRLPTYRIAALSGASAGNINSLLLAIQACDATLARPAEQSALWDVWMQAGLPQLLPRDNSDTSLEPGLFDRTFFNTVVKARLNDELAQRALPGCVIPIVATMSKLVPTRFQFNRLIDVSVQRHVASYSLESEQDDRTGGARFVLRAAKPLVQRDTALGKQIALRTIDGRPGVHDFGQVFELMKASSSVAYLFAPTALSYCDAAAAAVVGGCGPSFPGVEVERARFVDGGVIDNAPIFAAMRLMVLRDSLERVRAPRLASRDHGTLFVSYGARRKREDAVAGAGTAARIDDGRPTDGCGSAGSMDRCGGVGALLQFLGGFFGTSTQYELQWLVRLRAQSPGLQDVDVDVTTRHPAIVGERLKNASAFLGRPFREFDFQVGIYDALHFVANSVLCLPEHRLPSDSLGMDRCVIDSVRRLVDRFPLSCQSSLAVSLLLRQEHGIETTEQLRAQPLRGTAHCDASSNESRERALAYRSIFDALAFINTPGALHCRAGVSVIGFLCRDGTIELFRRLAEDEFFSRYAEREAAACGRSVGTASGDVEWEQRLARCFADDEFVAALHDPQDAFFKWIRALLDRAQWLEEASMERDSVGDPLLGLEAVTQAANVLFRSALLAEDVGTIAFPTIVPKRRGAWRTFTGIVLPQEIAYEALGSGADFFWHPLAYRWKSGLAVSATAGIIRNTFASAGDSTGKSRAQSRAAASLLMGFRPIVRGSYLLTGVSGGLRFWRPSTGDRLDDASWNRFATLSPEVKLDLLWDRASVRVSRNPGFGAIDERRKMRVALSLNDVGGLLYWVMRSPSLR